MKQPRKIYRMKRQILALVITLLSTFSYLQASHMMGADMSYRCLGKGKYHITAKVYRDCRGISFNGPDFGVWGGQNGGNGCGSYSMSISRTGIRDVTPRCSTQGKPCNPQNTGGTGEGIEEHTYEVTVDFNTSPLNNFVNKSTCCEVTFYIGQCCRNGAITTGPAGNDFWTTCMVNICNLPKTTNKCNSSPTLSNEPIGFLCCNQAYYFNNGAIDTIDYDSFSYSLAPGINSRPANSVNYTSPFSYQYPMTPYCIPPTNIKCTPNLKTDPPRGFFLDTASGDLIFTPTKCDEVGIVVIEITEWRRDSATGKYLMVGKTRRDIQLIVKDDCGYNKAPKIDGPTVNKVCEGDKLCFDIKGTDETFTPFQTIPDTVQMKWNNGIPGATFTIKNPTDREKTAQFCWQTRVGQASDVAYSFTVTATDDHCPKPTYSIRGFKVRVNPRAFDTRKYTILKCGRFAYEATLEDGFKGVAQYKWSFRDSNGNNEFYFSGKRTDTMTFKKGGKFIIVHTVNNSDNCPTIYRDTVIIPDPPTAILATVDTFACFGTKLTLEATVLYAKAPYRYYWTRPFVHTSGDTLKSLTLNSVDRDSTIQVRVTDGDGCVFYDTATVFLKPLPGKPNMADQRICTYQTATFDALHADTMFYSWNTGDTTRTITKNVAGDYRVTITDTIWGCQIKDTVHLFVNDTVVALAGSDVTICTNGSYDITATHRNAALTPVYEWTDITTGASLGSNATYKVSPKNTNGNGNPAKYFSYDLWTKITQGGVTCEDHDTMTIKVNTLPKVQWTKNPLDARCYDYGNITLNDKVVEPKGALRNASNFRIWGALTKYSPIGLVDSAATGGEPKFDFFTKKLDNEIDLGGGKNVTETLTLWFKDTNGCVNTAKTTQRINGNPVIVLDTSVYCQDKGWAKMDSSVIRPKTKFGTKQAWEVLQVPGGVNPSNVLVDQSGGAGTDWELLFGTPTEDYYAGDYLMKFSVTDQVTGCFAVDTTLVMIVTEPTVKVSPPGSVCLNWDTMDLRDYVLLNGFKPAVNNQNRYSIVEYRYDRNDPKVSSTKLDKGYLFHPGSGPGDWLIKFSSDETGCLKEDSFYITVNDTPTATLLAPLTLCSTSPALNLDSRVTNVNPSSSTLAWSGDSRVSGNLFTPTSKDSATLEGIYNIKLVVTDNNNCQARYVYPLVVRS
ncbi:MAG: hypothetical protein IT244_13960, partial [Bacteroidia bacterium]|nr:hypothetical protein [Bacteroidia bacterium]